MSRYGSARYSDNDSDFYSPLVQARGVKSIRQMQTVVLKNPEVFGAISRNIWSRSLDAHNYIYFS